MPLSVRYLVAVPFLSIAFASFSGKDLGRSREEVGVMSSEHCGWSFVPHESSSVAAFSVPASIEDCSALADFLRTHGFELKDGMLSDASVEVQARWYTPEYFSVASLKKQLKSYVHSKIFKTIGFFDEANVILLEEKEKALLSSIDHAPGQIHVRAVLWLSDQQFHAHQGLSAPMIARASFEEWLVHLQDLEAKGSVELLAQPELYVAERKKAMVSSGEEIPYMTQDGKKKHILFKKALLSLKVHAVHVGTQGATVEIEISVDKASEHWYQGHVGIARQQIKTQVRLPFSETRVLGGVEQRRSSTHKTCMPIVSWMPLLGSVFCDRSEKNNHSVLYALLSVEPW